MFYSRDWRSTSIEQFIQLLDAYIRWYNEKRIKSSLGYRSPSSTAKVWDLQHESVQEIRRTPRGSDFDAIQQPGISFLRIDHILVDQSIGVARAYVGGKEASPHRPVVADLLLNRQP